MLRSITIKNFRSCEDVTLRLDEPVVALIGKNGTGKTNLLHAIKFAADMCVGNAVQRSTFGTPNPKGRPEVSLEFELEGAVYSYRAGAMRLGSVRQFDEVLSKGNRELFNRRDTTVSVPDAKITQSLQIGILAATLPSLLQTLPDSDPLVADLRAVRNYLQSVRYYSLAVDSRDGAIRQGDYGGFEREAIVESEYASWKAALDTDRPDNSVLMQLLHLHLKDRSRFEEIETLLGVNGLGVVDKISISAFTSVSSGREKLPGGYLVYFAPGRDLAGASEYFGFSQLSAGTQRIIRLITHLIFDQSSCMLLEQPEDSIHPGMLEKVLDILAVYAYRTQLICTTHSPHTINQIPAAGIRLVTAENGKTVVEALSPDEIARAKNYIEEDGTFAEFLETF